MNLISWTDDPLTSANNAKGVYLQELQHNTNYAREVAAQGLSQWTNAAVGQKFLKAHMDELKASLEDPALLGYYGYDSISDILGRPWSSLPNRGPVDLAGYQLLNDMRTVVNAMTDVTFELGIIWTASEATGLVYDEKPFSITITAKRGGAAVTNYGNACTVGTDQTSESGNTIAGGDWVNGVVDITAMEIVFNGTPDEVVLTCTDDLTGRHTGTKTAPTDTATPVTSVACSLYYGCRSGFAAGEATQQEALDAAIVVYNNNPVYDDLQPRPPQTALRNPYQDGSTPDYASLISTGKSQRQLGTGPYTCGVGYGTLFMRCNMDTFGEGPLMLKMRLHDPNPGASSGYDPPEIVVGVPKTDRVYETGSDPADSKARWDAAVATSVLVTIPNASLVAGAFLIIDLGITKSSLAGLPLQVFFNPGYIETFDGSGSGYNYGIIHIDDPLFDALAPDVVLEEF